jgi:hypothetical protein
MVHGTLVQTKVMDEEVPNGATYNLVILPSTILASSYANNVC